MNKDIIDNLFEQMPLEKPSVGFNLHVMELIKKEDAAKARKIFIWKMFAAISLSGAILVAMYIFVTPFLIKPFGIIRHSLAQMFSHDYTLYFMIFGIALFLLILDDYMRLYFKRKVASNSIE